MTLDDLLSRARIIPVITIDDPAHAIPLAHALVAGGLPLLEITLRTAAGLAAATAIARHVPGAIVGIGTVLTPSDLRRAEDSGAQFALSPGATPALLEAAASRTLPFIPGIATPSELLAATLHGFTTVKFFPAAALGGPAALRALAGPFPHARFCPTGGITEATAASYLALPNVPAIGGSWLTQAADLRAQAWPRIAAAARRAVQLGSQAGVPPRNLPSSPQPTEETPP